MSSIFLDESMKCICNEVIENLKKIIVRNNNLVLELFESDNKKLKYSDDNNKIYIYMKENKVFEMNMIHIISIRYYYNLYNQLDVIEIRI